MTPDRIEKAAVLHAPLARVWSAVSDARRFGSWFGVEFDGPFEERREQAYRANEGGWEHQLRLVGKYLER